MLFCDFKCRSLYPLEGDTSYVKYPPVNLPEISCHMESAIEQSEVVPPMYRSLQALEIVILPQDNNSSGQKRTFAKEFQNNSFILRCDMRLERCCNRKLARGKSKRCPLRFISTGLCLKNFEKRAHLSEVFCIPYPKMKTKIQNSYRYI